MRLPVIRSEMDRKPQNNDLAVSGSPLICASVTAAAAKLRFWDSVPDIV